MFAALRRFVIPAPDQVTIDGIDIREYNVKYLRQHIGVVSQEPVLFGTTIAENVRYGRDGVTTAEVVDATRQANAYDFIMKLPEVRVRAGGVRGGGWGDLGR